MIRARALQGVGVGLGLFAILALTLAVFGLPVLESLQQLALGAFGDRAGMSRTLVKSTPLLVTGLGILIAWRAGIYNIGGEGQFVVGGLSGATVAAVLPGGAPQIAAISVIIAASIVGGAAFASIAGWLAAKRGIEVAISTILLNFVAIQLLSWACEGPLQETKGQLPVTELLPTAWMLPKLDPQTDFHGGMLIALGATLASSFLLYRTLLGYRMRLVGANPRAARTGRIDVNATQLKAMALSGALCGLAGGIEYVGVAGQLGASFAQGWGFLAIPVALIAGLQPLLVPFSAIFFGGVLAGSEHLTRFTATGTTLLFTIQGAAVLGWVALSRFLDQKRVAKEAT